MLVYLWPFTSYSMLVLYSETQLTPNFEGPDLDRLSDARILAVADGHREHITALKNLGKVKNTDASIRADNSSDRAKGARINPKTITIMISIAFTHLVPYLYSLADSVITHICSCFIID